MTRLIHSHIFVSRCRSVSNWENLEANIINIRTVKADFFINTFAKKTYESINIHLSVGLWETITTHEFDMGNVGSIPKVIN